MKKRIVKILVTTLVVMSLLMSFVATANADLSAVEKKVNSIVSTLVDATASAYKRAKVLHDWLINNATYDYTYSNYYADGVLLEGTGVCQSYALAYQKLANAAGLECEYVVSDTLNHGWNLVKIEDKWYHVDCTWDDPGEGGGETDIYFLLSSQKMEMDHPDWYIRGADADAYETDSNAFEKTDPEASVTITSLSDLDTYFENLIASGERPLAVHIYYYGDMSAPDFAGQWVNNTGAFYRTTIWSSSGNTAWTKWEIVWYEGDEYINLLYEREFLDPGDSIYIGVMNKSIYDGEVEWSSSDPEIATVDENGMVTGVKPGKVVITAQLSGTEATDTIDVTVMEPYQADFSPSFERTGTTAGKLTWKKIPGATEYRVYAMAEDEAAYTLMSTTSSTSAYVTLAADKEYSFYIKAQRIGDGEVIAVHKSGKLGDYVLPKAEDYALVYDHDYYAGKYASVNKLCGGDADAMLNYFVHTGMSKGQRGSENFSLDYYRLNYPELEEKYGSDLAAYYNDFMTTGAKNGLVADHRLLTITEQPATVIAAEGAKATATVKAVGDGLTYAWYFKDEAAEEYTLTTAFTGRSYSITMNADRVNRQVYCVVSDKYGDTKTTAVATLGMEGYALVTKQPASVTGPNGKTLKVPVTAAGDGLTYRWYFKDVGDEEFSYTSSIKTNTYAVKMNADRDGRQVYCVITDTHGHSVTSGIATLSMGGNAKITQQPVGVTVDNGKMVKLSVQGTGEGLSYKWYVKSVGGSFKKSSLTSSTYSVKMTGARHGNQVYCVVSDRYGNSETSETVTIYMTGAAAITQQPASVTVPYGTNATAKVIAQGEGLTYTWYVKSAGGSSFTKSTNTTDTYSVKMLSSRNGNQVYCVVKDKYGVSVTSETATFSMAEILKITKQPSNAAAEAGQTVSVSIAAKGEDVTYTWYVKAAGTSKFKKSSTATDTYSVTMTSARNGNQLYCVVTDKYGCTVTSKTVTISTPKELKITQQPASVKVASGAKASVSVGAEGDGLTYAWYVKSVGAGSFKKSSLKAASYSVQMNASRDGNQVYCVVKDQYGNSLTTNTVTLSMIAPVTIIQQPASVAVTAGAKATVTVKAEGDGLTYAWYVKAAGASSFKKSSVTSATYSVQMISSRDGNQVYCVVTDQYGNSVQSATATLTKK